MSHDFEPQSSSAAAHPTSFQPNGLMPSHDSQVATAPTDGQPQNDEALSPPLTDSFGRVHRSLRISVTDRCNIRCQYCMPASDVQFMPSNRLLTFDEITWFARAAVTLGIREIRITGGEPLMRPNLHELIQRLSSIPELDDVALTTNGMLLDEQIDKLVDAGLRRINISLDTLRDDTFRRLARRDGLDRVLAGIEAALAHRQLQLRLNTLVMRDINLDEVVDLVHFARKKNLPIRFIEFMPLDAERNWNRESIVSGAMLRDRLSQEFGQLVPLTRNDSSQPAIDFGFADGLGQVGFIDSVTQPFCSTCDRLRLTADGKIRNCLFAQEEWDVREAIRQLETSPGGLNESSLAKQIRECISRKRQAHGMDSATFQPPERAMFQIGG